MPRGGLPAAAVDALLWPAMYALCVVSFNAATDQEGRKEFISLDDEDNFLTNEGYKGFTREKLEWMWSATHLDVWEPVAWFFKAGIWTLFGSDHDDSAQGWLHAQIFLHTIGGFMLFLSTRKLLRHVYHGGASSTAVAAGSVAGGSTPQPPADTSQQPEEAKQSSTPETAVAAQRSQPLSAHRPSAPLVTAAAFLGALFWAIHPLRGEALGWISCSSYNIGSGFVFGSLFCYTSYVEARLRLDERGRTAAGLAACAGWYGAALVCYFLGIACKTPAVGVLIVFPVVDAFLQPERLFPPVKWLRPQGAFFDKLPFAAVAVWCVRMAAPKDDACGNERTPGACLTAFEKFVRGMWALCFYVRMTLWPVQHQPHYGLQKGPLALDVNDYMLPVAVVLVAVGVSLVVFGRFVLAVARIGGSASADGRARQATLVTPAVASASLCLVYVATSVPSLGFIQHGVPTMAADRYNYFSGGWVAVAFALLVLKLFQHTPAPPQSPSRPAALAAARPDRVRLWDGRVVSLTFVVCVLVLLTRATTRVWTNTRSLYTYALRFRDGASGFALNNYGYFHYQLEEWGASERITKQAIMVDPTQLKATINLADIYQYHTHEVAKAIEVYEGGLVASPNSGSLVNNLVVAYAKVGDHEMADHMHQLVPLVQADWGDQADDTMSWALQEKERLKSVLVPPNVPHAELSPVQQRLGAQCWKRPGSSNANCLPSFVLLGTRRAATGTLYELLQQHSQTAMWHKWNRRKGDYLTKQNLHRRAYAESLPVLREGVDAVVGDFSTDLFLHFDGPRRMKAFAAPGTKFLVAVRNPVLRAFSHWVHNRALRLDNHSAFMDASRVEGECLSNPHCLNAATATTAHDITCYPQLRHFRSHFTIRDLPKNEYLAWGLYHHQLHNWLQEFPLESFLFVDVSELAGDAAAVRTTLGKVADHVGLDPFPAAAPPNRTLPLRRNTAADDAARYGRQPRQLTARVLRRLGRFFAPHNRAFYEMAGRDFGWEAEVARLAATLEAGGGGAGPARGRASGGGGEASARARAGGRGRGRAASAAPAYSGVSRPKRK